MAPGYPPNPNMMMAQGAPNPYYYAPQGGTPAISPQGYPMAPMNYPTNYQGPQPPNPNYAQQQAPTPNYAQAQVGMPQASLPPGSISPQGYPVAPMNYPTTYQGPQAPNPAYAQQQQMSNPNYGQPQFPLQPAQMPMQIQPVQVPAMQTPPTLVQPLQYSQPPMQNYPAPANQPTNNPAMDRRQAPGTQSQEQTQAMQALRDSPYPAQREWAANTLGTYDWRAHPEVVQVLLSAAQQDAAATVRSACVYSLAHMNAASEPVMSVLYGLRNDGDPRVRQEVDQALVRLGAARK